MPNVPTKFRKGGDASINYTFLDFASGTGVVTFYLSKATTKYIMTTTTPYSQTVLTNIYGSGGTSFDAKQTIDFDVELQRPSIMKGETSFNAPYAFQAQDSGNFYTYLDMTLKKVSEGTETTIKNVRTRTLSGGNLVSGNYKRVIDNVNTDIPLTHFKKGDIIRLTVAQMVQTNTAQVKANWFFGHDPKSRATSEEWDDTGGPSADTNVTFDTSESQFTVNLPFRIDL